MVIAGLFKITLSDFVGDGSRGDYCGTQRCRNAQRAHDIPNASITVWLAMQLNPLQVCAAASHQSPSPSQYSLQGCILQTHAPPADWEIPSKVRFLLDTLAHSCSSELCLCPVLHQFRAEAHCEKVWLYQFCFFFFPSSLPFLCLQQNQILPFFFFFYSNFVTGTIAVWCNKGANCLHLFNLVDVSAPSHYQHCARLTIAAETVVQSDGQH